MATRSPESRPSELTVVPIAGALGAEISGVDLNRSLAPQTISALRSALLDHLVIFFRDQDLTPEAYLSVAKAFGTPVAYPMLKGLPGFPTINEVVKLEHELYNFGGMWHSDTSYLEQPSMGALLYAIEVPPYGGDTLFANQILAYEALSEPMRRILDQLTAVNTSAKADISKTREDMIRQFGDGPVPEFVSEHPAVRTHPETGRKSLYLNVSHTIGFRGMTEAESAPLLEFLFAHQVRPEFTCRFAWRRGSLAFWDNRATLHNPVNDYHGHRRVMQRISLAGDRPA